VSGSVLISEGKRQYNNAKTLITNAKYTPAETAERSSEQCCEFGYFYLRNYKNSSNPLYKVFHPVKKINHLQGLFPSPVIIKLL